jgi:2-methylisocitrate lyase-like PEP mutase family enzyme
MADYATLTCPTMKHQAMTSRSPRRELRDILVPGAALLLPGVANALAARVVADQGFAAAYVTGAGIANTFFGVPDIGLVTVSELAAHVAAIREAFAGPLVVDADTGFGNAVNVVRTVQLLERAGADALQIEDQVFPKRCGHFAGKEVIPAAEMVAKIKAAVDTRHDPDLLIIARTDAIAPEGFAAALERAAAYREAGADVTFVEAPTSIEEIAEIPRPSSLAATHQHRHRRPHAGIAQREAQRVGLRRRDLCQPRAAIGAQRHAGGAGRASAQGTYRRRAKSDHRFLRAATPGAQG